MEDQRDEELEGINEDYGLVPIDEEILTWAKNACRDIYDFLPMFFDIKIVMAKLEKGTLGKFRSETESSPIVILCPKNIKKSVKEQRVSMELAVLTTVYHEIGHAFYKLCINSEVDVPADEEDFAEEFARSIWESGCLSYETTELLSKIIPD